jgi:exonuclease III
VEEKEAALSAAIKYAKRTKEWHDNLTVYKWWRALRIIHEEKKSHTLWNAHKPTRT